MKKLTLKDFQERLEKCHSKEQLQAINYFGNDKECQVKCLTCGNVYTKKAGCFLDKRKVSICKICFPTQSNTFKTNYTPSNTEYELVGDYKGMQEKTLIRHKKCGFVWEVKPNNLEFGKGCPKCNKKISKGEQKIINFLEKHQINYIAQFPIVIESHKLFCDFYLPELDLYIEYNGEQHYNPIAFFGGQEKFQKQVYYDNLKKNFLQDKLLIISYLDYINIESILRSSTTIPEGSTSEATAEGSGKLLEKEEDIV